MFDPVWTVHRHGDDVRVTAEMFWTNDHGDLLFGYHPEPTQRQGVTITLHPVPSRAFAAGTWKEVSLYA